MSETTTTPETTYRIVRLEANNIKRLKAVEIVPNRNVVKLTGANAQGKSSILDAILWVLAGGKAIPDQPIRKGASRAESVLDLGDFVCTLKITKSGATLTVKSKDGADIRAPATLLKQYTNDVLIDPVAFLRLGETPEGRRRQAEKLRQLVGLDFTQLDAEKERTYKARTIKNGELTAAQGKLGNYSLVPDVPATEVSVKALMDQLTAIEDNEAQAMHGANRECDEIARQARTINGDNDAVKRKFEEGGRAITEENQRLAAINEEIRQLQARLTERNQAKVKQEDVIRQLENQQVINEHAVAKLKYEDLLELDKQRASKLNNIRENYAGQAAPIRKQISEADDINTKVRNNKRYKELKDEVRKLQEESDAMTALIEEIDRIKSEQLAGAKFPLDGLSFDESGILLNGLPLNQGSQAQQLKVILAIGFALKPKIRVALVRDASILDDDSLKEVQAMMDQWDAQVWLECVRSDDPTALVIEDGAIKE